MGKAIYDILNYVSYFYDENYHCTDEFAYALYDDLFHNVQKDLNENHPKLESKSLQNIVGAFRDASINLDVFVESHNDFYGHIRHRFQRLYEDHERAHDEMDEFKKKQQESSCC